VDVRRLFEPLRGTCVTGATVLEPPTSCIKREQRRIHSDSRLDDAVSLAWRFRTIQDFGDLWLHGGASWMAWYNPQMRRRCGENYGEDWRSKSRGSRRRFL